MNQPSNSTPQPSNVSKKLGRTAAIVLAITTALGASSCTNDKDLPNKPEITYNSGTQFFKAFNIATNSPRSGEGSPTEDTFDNAYNFIRDNSEYATMHKLSSTEGEVKEFDIDGVKYKISADYTSGEYMFSISWTSDKKDEDDNIIRGKYVIKRTGPKGDLRFLDGDKDEEIIDAEKLKELLGNF